MTRPGGRRGGGGRGPTRTGGRVRGGGGSGGSGGNPGKGWSLCPLAVVIPVVGLIALCTTAFLAVT